MKTFQFSNFLSRDFLSNLAEKARTISPKDKVISVLTIVLILSVGVVGCSGPSNKLPVVYTFKGLHAEFVNQDSEQVEFPAKYQGTLFVMSFIYTHCPDVCPMTISNLHALQDSLAVDGINGVRFVTLTYDPNRDTPEVLKKYAEERGIKFNDWDFLTGSRSNIDSVVNRVRIKYNFIDSSYTGKGKLSYFVHHPDECLLVDDQGGVRGIYSGTHLDYASIIEDIRTMQ